MVIFDATVDFETSALCDALIDAMRNIPMLSLECRWPLTAVVYADGNRNGELFAADEEQPTLTAEDWVVTGDTAQELTDKLRALLHA